MLYKEIIQGSFEWKELKYRKLGGTSSDKVMANFGKPIQNNAIFFKMLKEFCEEFEFEEEIYLPKAMVRGNELEPIAREEFARIYDKKVFEIGWSESSDFTGISPDGIIGDESIILTNLDVADALEIKCPEGEAYSRYLVNNQDAIEDYSWQLVDYFKEFPNLNILYFMIYRPENLIKSHILIKITRDTVISVDKKKRGKLADLCAELTERQIELKTALKEKIEELKKPTNNF